MEHDDDMLPQQLARDLDNSFHLVVEGYADELLRYIRTKVDDLQAAQDIVQDIFMRAWLAFRGYSPERRSSLHLRSWLYTAAKNACLNYRRQQKTQRNALASLYIDLLVDTEITSQELAETVIESMDHSQAIDQLRFSLQTLSLPYRETIHLHYFENMSCQEIADHSQQSIGTIKSQLFRGRGLLRELIEVEKERREQEHEG